MVKMGYIGQDEDYLESPGTPSCDSLQTSNPMQSSGVAHRTVGYGHLDQGRFQCFPVQSDEHLLTVLRYIERNAVGPGWSRGRSTGAGGWKQGRAGNGDAASS